MNEQIIYVPSIIAFISFLLTILNYLRIKHRDALSREIKTNNFFEISQNPPNNSFIKKKISNFVTPYRFHLLNIKPDIKSEYLYFNTKNYNTNAIYIDKIVFRFSILNNPLFSKYRLERNSVSWEIKIKGWLAPNQTLRKFALQIDCFPLSQIEYTLYCAISKNSRNRQINGTKIIENLDLNNI